MEENLSSKASASGGVDNVSTEDPNKHLGHCSKESIHKFNGIMPHQNGSWGSQMCSHSHQIWLGTIKSEKEPEMAYDSTVIQLRCGSSRRNFPWTDGIVKESNFQHQYGQEAVLEMIRGGSCQQRFQGLLHGDNYGNTESGIFGLKLSAMQKRGGFSRKLLFRKMLTPSDVGRLNRIVIPKKSATTCFSEISRRMEEDAKAGMLADAQVDFFDSTMRSWRFRYCYWKSSQSYVFTRGWSRFVKDKNLKVNDVVAFYSCEFHREGKTVNKFFMIEPVRGEEESAGGSIRSSPVIGVADDYNGVGLNHHHHQHVMLSSVVFGGPCYNNVGLRPEIGSSVSEGASYHHHHHHHVHELKSELFSDDVEKKHGKQVMMDAESPSNVVDERQGFRLFGVQITDLEI